MTRKMLINVVEPEEIRLAILKNDNLDELYIERTARAKYQGNIYKGKVVHIEPSIQACFVNFGEDTNGFLHVSDTIQSWERDSNPKNKKKGKKLYIKDVVKRGHELMIQVTKESIGTKAPTVTTCLTLPGRYLVLMPNLSRRGVSKKIMDEKERKRLKKMINNLNIPEGMGAIARTAASGQPKKTLERDLNYLLKLWDLAKWMSKKEKAPTLIYRESDLVIKTIRDIYSQDIKEIIIDEEEVYRKVKDFLRMIMPRHKRNVRLYNKREPLFYNYKIEEEIKKIYERKVELKSGGSIVIDQTEALVAVDVNTGKFKGERDLEETAYKTNLEAAVEIARQIRLRDLGGLVVCDFIDMHKDRHRRKVEKTFRDELKEDPAKTKIARMSKFCMVELSRQRLRPSLNSYVYSTCPNCSGLGLVKTIDSMCVDIMRQIKHNLVKNDNEKISIVLNPNLASYIQNSRRKTLHELEEQYNKSIVIKQDTSFNVEDFRFEE